MRLFDPYGAERIYLEECVTEIYCPSEVEIFVHGPQTNKDTKLDDEIKAFAKKENLDKVIQPDGEYVFIKGPINTDTKEQDIQLFKLPQHIHVRQGYKSKKNKWFLVSSPEGKSQHDFCYAYLNNIISGLVYHWHEFLSLVGTGYKVRIEYKQDSIVKLLSGDKFHDDYFFGRLSLLFKLGHSHEDEILVDPGIAVYCPSPTEIILKSTDRQKLQNFVASVKRIREPDPYGGKGIIGLYDDVRRKDPSGKKT